MNQYLTRVSEEEEWRPVRLYLDDRWDLKFVISTKLPSPKAFEVVDASSVYVTESVPPPVKS